MKKTALMCLLALGVGCGDDDGGPVDSGGGGTDSGAVDSGGGGDTRTLSYDFTGLPALGADFVYEGWIIVDDAPVTTGRFTIGDDGNPTPATFEVPAAMVEMATAFVLSIEPAVGDDPAPAATKILGGPLASGSATLSIAFPAALNDDFSSATGTFFLATPTSTATDDDNLGIWFITPGEPPTAGLTLPALPAGWVYEGWVVDTSGDAPAPVSTGRFTDVAAADDNGAGPGAGSEAAPPFPGEDFVTPPVDLTAEHMAVLTVEPEPDDSPAPFQIKPLGLPIGTDVSPANPYTMNNIIADNTVTGTATFE
ncbi:MAG: hypothetical protein AAGE52_24760 [Myxococcota bacterium]